MGYDPTVYYQGRSATFEFIGAGLEVSPGAIDFKEWINIFMPRDAERSSNISLFTKQIHGPTNDKKTEMFLQLLCHFCYTSFTCTWSELENRGSIYN
ncbi:hypothetical protein Bca101_021409 [Brassica carinata]